MTQTQHLRLTSDSTRTLVAVLTLVGVGLGIVHLQHFVADLAAGHGVIVTLGGAGLPFAVAVGIVGCAVRLGRRPEQIDARRVLGWIAAGGASLLLVAGGALAYEVAEGASLTHPTYLLLDFVTVGVAGGTLVGWYDARNAARRRELAIFREMVSNAGHSIYLTDTDGVIRYVNPAFEDRTGYERSEAVGRTPRILNSGEHDDGFFEDLWETISDGDPWQSEVVNRRRDGSLYRVDQTITPLESDEEIVGFVAVSKDVTELREREAELERKNRRLDEFASVVSHDLRTPLQVASGHLTLLAETGDPHHHDTAARALTRMERLIEDVLLLAREGSAAVDPEPVDLETVATEAWEPMSGQGATLRTEAGEVNADRSLLHQLLANLLRNAVDHGGSEVTVTVEQTADGFAVTDDGTGIDPGLEDRILESGFTTRDDGTGLGLQIVQQIADDHGWTVEVGESETGGARIELVDVTRPETAIAAPTV